MQSSPIWRPAVRLSGLQRIFYRNIAAASETVGVKEDLKEDLKSWKEIPGPKSWPIIGAMLNFMPGGEFYKVGAGVLGRELTELMHKKFGPIVCFNAGIGLGPLIFLFDPEAVSQVLRGENTRLPIRPGFQSLEYYRRYVKKDRRPDQPTGLITDHNEKWKEFRSTVNPVLLQPKTIKLYKTVLDEVGLEMITRMKSQRDEKNMIRGNFMSEMNLWSLESIGVVALGCRLGCLDPNLPKDSKAHELITCVHELFVIANELDFRKTMWKFVSTAPFRRGMKLYEKQETLSKHFVNQAIKELKSKTKSDDQKGVLEKLLEINEEYAHIMANDMLFAGVDTAANTVTATLYMLATNPDKQQKLREELLSDSDKRPYLKACIKEGMRMMPIVSGNIRQTTREYNILGYKIPSDMLVVFNHQQMSLLEENFVRPNEYIPERWLVSKDDPLSYRHANPFSFNPFGFGVRSCVGRRIAELEMELFVARLIENFEVDWFGPPPKIEQKSLNYIKGPFNFIFNDVKK